jgi:hypothetical protein
MEEIKPAIAQFIADGNSSRQLYPFNPDYKIDEAVMKIALIEFFENFKRQMFVNMF